MALAPISASLSPSASGCTSTTAGSSCTISIDLPVGSYSAAIATYDGPLNAAGAPTGSVLSENQTLAFTVSANSANVVGVTLLGLPSSIQFTPDATESNAIGNTSFGYALIGKAGVRFDVVAYDADGYAIVGPGSPSFGVVSNGSQVVVDQAPSAQQPNTVILRGPAFSPTAANVHVTIQNAASYGSSCGACSLDVNVNAGAITIGGTDIYTALGQLPIPVPAPGMSSGTTLGVSSTGTIFIQLPDAGRSVIVVPPPYDHVAATISNLAQYENVTVDPNGILYFVSASDAYHFTLLQMAPPYQTATPIWSTTTTTQAELDTIAPSINGAVGIEYQDNEQYGHLGSESETIHVVLHGSNTSGFTEVLTAPNVEGTQARLEGLPILSTGGDYAFVVGEPANSGSTTLNRYAPTDLAKTTAPGQSSRGTTDGAGDFYQIGQNSIGISAPPYAAVANTVQLGGQVYTIFPGDDGAFVSADVTSFIRPDGTKVDYAQGASYDLWEIP